MRSRGRFCVFCHLSQIAESERRFSFSMSINALIEFARARAGALPDIRENRLYEIDRFFKPIERSL